MKKVDLAKAVGVAPGTLSRYLNGSISPDLPVILGLARQLMVTPEWLSGSVPEAAELEEPYDYAARHSSTDVPKKQPATPPVLREPCEPYLPDAVALTGLDADERKTILRMLDALRSGDQEIRRHLIGQLKIIEVALNSRRQQLRQERKDGA